MSNQTDRQTGPYPFLLHFLCQEETRTNSWHHFLLRTITQEQAGSFQKRCHGHNNPEHSQEHTHTHTYSIYTHIHTQTHNGTIVSSELSISSVYWHNFEALYISVCLGVLFSIPLPFLSSSYLVSFNIVCFFQIHVGICTNISLPLQKLCGVSLYTAYFSLSKAHQSETGGKHFVIWSI